MLVFFDKILRAASGVPTVVSRITVVANFLVLILVDDFSLCAEWVSNGLLGLDFSLDLLDELLEDAADGGAGLDTGACHNQDQH